MAEAGHRPSHCTLLTQIASVVWLAMQVVVGMNGKVIVRSDSVSNTVLAANVILKSEALSDVQCEILVRSVISRTQA